MGVPRKDWTKQLAAPHAPEAMWMPMQQGAMRPVKPHRGQYSRAMHRALASSAGKSMAQGRTP